MKKAIVIIVLLFVVGCVKELGPKYSTNNLAVLSNNNQDLFISTNTILNYCYDELCIVGKSERSVMICTGLVENPQIRSPYRRPDMPDRIAVFIWTADGKKWKAKWVSE